MQTAEMTKREKLFTLRMDDEEQGRLNHLAAHYGITIAAVIRMLAKEKYDALTADDTAESTLVNVLHHWDRLPGPAAKRGSWRALTIPEEVDRWRASMKSPAMERRRVAAPTADAFERMFKRRPNNVAEMMRAFVEHYDRLDAIQPLPRRKP